MRTRYAPAAVSGIITLGSVLISLIVGDAFPGAIFIAAGGAPVTVLLVVRGIVGPGRRLWPSVLLGAIGVPILVIALNAAFAAAAFALLEPALEALSELSDTFRVDRELLDVFTGGFALVFIVELAVVAPFAEETLKPLGALIRRPKSRAEALLFGVAAGTGFAVVENLLYATGWLYSWNEWLGISILRMPGAALHAFGAGLVSLGFYEFRRRSTGVGGLLRRYGTAFGAHALWNGTIAVTIVLFAEVKGSGAGFSDASLAWGITLAVMLAALGAVIMAGLVVVARQVASGRPVRVFGVRSLDRPAAVAAWSLVTGAVLVPVVILVVVFPGLVAL